MKYKKIEFRYRFNHGRKLIYNPEFRQRIYVSIAERKSLKEQAKKAQENLELNMMQRMSSIRINTVLA